VVGDMALYMVTNDLSPEQVLDPAKEINFPESVISLFRGEMGYPADGFPKELGKKILKDKVAIEGRAGAHLESTNLEAAKKEAEEKVNRHINDTELASYLMYPKVFTTFAEHYKHNGDVSLLPTPVFFYGLNTGEEMAIEIDPGKTLVIRLQGTTPVDEEGIVRVFFELNGQPRTVKVKKLGATATKVGRIKAEVANPKHIAAPLPGMIAAVAVKEGQSIQKGNPLVSIEAMKMETMITANEDGVIKKIHIASGAQVDAKDLLIEFT
jgi:pyruvate carboxylase